MNAIDHSARDAEKMLDAARTWHGQRRWAEAAEAARRAVEIADRAGPDLILLEALSVLGNAWRQQGLLREAEAVLRRALTVAGAYPGEPLRIAAACNDLGMLSQAAGHFLDAEHLYRRALAMIERSGERDGAMAATLYRNLGLLEHARGHYQRGLTPARKACQIRARLAGPDHPDTVADRMALAALYDALGRYADSRPIYWRALHVFERIHGPEHYEVAACLQRMAAVEHSEGRLAQAVVLYRRALAIEERLLGPLHPDTAGTARILVQVEEDRGRAVQAQRSIGRAIERVAGRCFGCEGMEACCRS